VTRVDDREVRTMNVRDVMSTRLIAVRPEEPLKELARILVRNRIGGVPVTDADGHVLGIVSETDLQPTREGAPGRPIRTAADVMTRRVITLTEEDTVTQAARVLQRHRVKRAPVLRQGVVVGMITRSDLLRPYLRTDSEIRADVEELLFADGLGLIPDRLDVLVEGGIVRLQGVVRDGRQQVLTLRLARGVEGVIDVVDDLQVAASPMLVRTR
jgi:CBS domain-containing protein